MQAERKSRPSPNHGHTTHRMTTSDDDPLQLKALSVNFDYLMFKIHDRIASLADTTHESVVSKKKLIESDYFGRQLQVDTQMASADALIQQCSELETLFMKLEQLYGFVDDFKTRVATLERQSAALTKK